MKKTQFSQFWNLRDSPFFGRFEISEDVLLSAQRALVTRVLIAAQQGAPIIGVFAEQGAGSTVVARWLYQNIPETTHYALILTPGSHDVSPSHMTERIKAFASARIPGVGTGGKAPVTVQDDSIRGQMAELLPVFDALRTSGKKIALIVDNAALLAGEPWAAFLLGILRQGELIEHVLQFVLIGYASDMSQMMQMWPRVLETRVSRFVLPRPSPGDLGTWLCNRLILAGVDSLTAEKVFTSAARKRLADLTSCSLPKLAWLAEGAMVEAFMAGSHVVEVDHVDRSHSGGSEPAISDSVRGQTVGGAGAAVRRPGSGIDAEWVQGQINQEPGKTGEPSLLDLIKPE